jgi:hypothetical protein
MDEKRWSTGLAEALFSWLAFYGLITTAVVMLGGSAILDATTDEFSIQDTLPNNALVLGAR